MSASKEKKNRMEQQGETLGKKAAAAAEQAKKDKAFRRNTIIAVAVIVVIVAAALFINSNFFYTGTTAVQVGNTKYSPAEVNYFFKTSFNRIYENYYNQLGSSVSMLVDTSKPLDQQQYSDDQTWADFVFESMQEDLKQITVYYDAAVKAGYTLNDEDNASVKSSLELMQSYADSNSFSSLDKFLAAYYGKGMNKALYTKLTEKVTLASRYSQDLLNDLNYSNAELEAYYQEHAEELDYYNFYLYSVSQSNEKFSDLADDAKADAAHAAAEEIAKADSVEAFIENVQAFVGEDYTPNMSHYTADSLGSSYKDWMMSADRKTGDTTVADLESSTYAIVYVGFDDNNYNTVNMRHILVSVEADENGEYTDEAKAAAEEKAKGILTEWELLKTEDAFITLANEYSDDTGSNTNGGLYTDITKNQMVPVINDYLFDPARTIGDYTLVYNEGSYVGYHIVYFAGENGNHRQELAKNAKSTADFNSNYEAMSVGYDVSTGSGLRFANLA